MLIFTIIIFGLSVVRTFTPFINGDAWKNGPRFIGTLLAFCAMLVAYIWFLDFFLISEFQVIHRGM